jgi:hypothetical protein
VAEPINYDVLVYEYWNCADREECLEYLAYRGRPLSPDDAAYYTDEELQEIAAQLQVELLD